MELEVATAFPFLWGGEMVVKSEWAPLTFFVGPNGTGKTLFAETARDHASTSGLRPRYLSAERLAGLEKAQHGWFTNPFLMRGWDISQVAQMSAEASTAGMAASAFNTLRDRLDVRIKVEGRLSHMFGRRLRLAEEGGFMRAKLSHSGGDEYDLKQAESHGLKEIISLITFLYDDEFNFLIFDEPELHLHPQYQSFFMEEVRSQLGDPRDDPAKKAFVLITHSPYILDIRTLDELQSVVMFQPDQVPKSIDTLDSQDEYVLRRLMPRLNTHHKQFFFASQPVFVEGYPDQQLFTLIDEARGRFIGAAGASYLDVNGKDGLDVFFRLARRLGIDGRVITDLDALLDGNLRQSVGSDPRCTAELAARGGGGDLMTAIGSLLGEVDRLADALVNLANGTVPLTAQQGRLVAYLAGHDLSHRRFAILAGLGMLALPPISEDSAFDLLRQAVSGRLDTVLGAMAAARVFVLPRGTLEAYLPAYTGDVYEATSVAKASAFDQERLFLLSGATRAAVEERFGELIAVLDRAISTTPFRLDPFINFALGDLIHEIQTSFRRVEWRTLEELSASKRISWERYKGFVTLESVQVGEDSFECRLRLEASVDPAQTVVVVKDDTVAASYDIRGR